MSIIRNRELSQFGSFIYIDDNTRSIGITSGATPFVGIGTTNPTVKFEVVGDTNIGGNLTIIGGTLDASSYTLNGISLVDAALAQWDYTTGNIDIYRLIGNVGIGTSSFTEKLTVLGNISAGQFISTVTSGTAPFVVLSDTQVTNLNASFLRGKVPPSGTIVGTTDTQTLINKTLTSPIISGVSFSSAGITFNGSTSGTTILQASASASGTLTLPATTDTLLARNTTDTLINKTIDASSNIITGLTNTNLSGSAGISNLNLENSTISNVPLGSNLNTLTFDSYLTSTGSYNGSTARTVSVAGTSVNTGNTLVARDISGDFTAGTITGAAFDATTTDAFRISGTPVIDSSRNIINVVDGTFSGIVVASSSVRDSNGNVRTIPQNLQSSSYTLQLTDVGKHITIVGSGVTVPSNVFTAGDAITIYNNSDTSHTITQGDNVTLRFSGTTSTGNRTILPYGIANILCVESNVFVIAGIIV
jgi:hypothetical protein